MQLIRWRQGWDMSCCRRDLQARYDSMDTQTMIEISLLEIIE